MRPMACESEESMLIAPRSWSTSSAASVSARMRDSAKARASGIFGFKWWQTISMSRCSSIVFTVNGMVGFVEDGRQFGSPPTRGVGGGAAPAGPAAWAAGARGGPPAMGELEAGGARLDLLAQGLGARGVALAEEAQVHRQAVGRFQHAVDVPRPRRAGRGVGPRGRPAPPPDQRGHAGGQGLPP